jgi:hypothetical protein
VLGVIYRFSSRSRPSWAQRNNMRRTRRNQLRVRTRPKSPHGLLVGSRATAFETDNGRSALVAGTGLHAPFQSSTARSDRIENQAALIVLPASATNIGCEIGRRCSALRSLRHHAWRSRACTVAPVSQLRACCRKSLICIRPVARLAGRGLDGNTHAPLISLAARPPSGHEGHQIPGASIDPFHALSQS